MPKHKSCPFGNGSGPFNNGVLQVLGRFFAIRGRPAVILSDNGSQFVGAEKELRQMVGDINEEEVK